MAFLLRQGRIRMEVVVGLLLVLGATLDGSEGIRCYEGTNDVNQEVTCAGSGANGCGIRVYDGDKITRGCSEVSERLKECLEKAQGADGCSSIGAAMSETELKILKACMKPDGRTATQNTTSRQGQATWLCDCFTDRCNEGNNGQVTKSKLENFAGHSTPNIQVIIALLVAASLYTFDIGVGSS